MNDWYCPYMEKLKDCKFEHGGGEWAQDGERDGGRKEARSRSGGDEGGGEKRRSLNANRSSAIPQGQPG